MLLADVVSGVVEAHQKSLVRVFPKQIKTRWHSSPATSRRLPASKENVAELVDGCGERVCYIINDLLNRELIKQNFRFKQPVVNDEEKHEDDPNEEIDYAVNIDDKLIDSSKLSRRAYFKYCDAIGIEDDVHKGAGGEAAFVQDGDDENDMIMPSVDPDDWLKECSRVTQYIDKDLDSKGLVIENKEASTKKALVDITAMDEILDKIEQISEHFSVITEFLEGDSK